MTTVAGKLAEYCRISMQNEPRWHYRQYRPMKFGVPPHVEQDGDCSGHATQSYWYAGAPDPNPGCNYNGTGYTGTLVNNPKVGSPYQIGDLAIYGTSYGNTTHVCTCFQAGSSSTARFTSHGSESGPYSTSLHYRSDLLCVVRPGLGNGGGGEVEVPAWYWDWARWYLSSKRDPKERPEKAPEKIPEWAWDYVSEDEFIARDRGMTDGERDWIVWYLGGKKGERPKGVPDNIPDFWWDDCEFVGSQRKVGDPPKV